MSTHLIQCKSCRNQIAKTAKTCPHCGAKVKKENHPVLGIIMLFFLIIGIIVTGQNNSEMTTLDIYKEWGQVAAYGKFYINGSTAAYIDEYNDYF